MTEEDNYLGRTVQELGPPLAEFSVQPWRFWSRLGIATLLLLYGLFANYYWWVIGPQKFNHLSFLLLFAPPGMGLSLLWVVLATRGLNILVYPTGLLRVQQQEVESYLWTEVVGLHLRADSGEIQVRYNENGHLVSCWIEPSIPILQIWNSSLVLERLDGHELRLSPTLANFGELVSLVQQSTFQTRWPEIWEQFAAGETLAFGPFEANLNGLQSGKKLLPWNEEANLSISSKHLVIKQPGYWSSWAKVELESVANPHLLVGLILEAWRVQGRVGPDDPSSDVTDSLQNQE